MRLKKWWERSTSSCLDITFEWWQYHQQLLQQLGMEQESSTRSKNSEGHYNTQRPTPSSSVDRLNIPKSQSARDLTKIINQVQLERLNLLLNAVDCDKKFSKVASEELQLEVRLKRKNKDKKEWYTGQLKEKALHRQFLKKN